MIAPCQPRIRPPASAGHMTMMTAKNAVAATGANRSRTKGSRRGGIDRKRRSPANVPGEPKRSHAATAVPLAGGRKRDHLPWKVLQLPAKGLRNSGVGSVGQLSKRDMQSA